jgi:hypothetical protein
MSLCFEGRTAKQRREANRWPCEIGFSAVKRLAERRAIVLVIVRPGDKVAMRRAKRSRPQPGPGVLRIDGATFSAAMWRAGTPLAAHGNRDAKTSKSTRAK